MSRWAEDSDVLSEAQARFRKDYSTVDHIFTLLAMVSKHLTKNKKLNVAFVDKAFGTVKRNVLWNVLLQLGIGGNMFSTLRAMYSSVLSCVRCKTRNTDYFNCMQGLKQGCLVNPVLFSFLINELASEILLRGKHGIQLLPREIELFLLMLADDIALLSSTPVGLQTQLNVLYEVANRFGLLVNLEKIKIVVFRNGCYLPRTERWYYGSELVSVTSSYKYLGLKLTTKVCLNRISEDSVVRA